MMNVRPGPEFANTPPPGAQAGHQLADGALIEFVHARSLEVGTGGLSWITAADNADAQRLYDELATRTSWVTYEMDS